MLVEQIMTHGVDFIDRTATVQEAAQKMSGDNVGILPVFDGNFLVGVVTDRDITVRLVAKGLDPAHTSVSQIMTHDIYFCRSSDTISKAAQIMEEKQVRRLLVKDEYGHLTGIVSLADLARAADENLTAEVLRRVTTPAHPRW